MSGQRGCDCRIALVSFRAMKLLRRFLQWLYSTLPEVVIWLIVIFSVIALITKWRYGRPSATPVHYLLVLILFVGLLPVLGPKLENLIVSKIRDIGIGTLKIKLLHKEASLSQLKKDFSDDALRPPTGKLSGRNLYDYERMSFWLYQRFGEIQDPSKLGAESSEYYRKVIRWVSKAAFLMKHYTKSLDVELHLQSLTDRELNAKEQVFLGSAYLWAARELPPQDYERRKYYRKSLPLLRAAMGKLPLDPNIPFNFAWALDSLGRWQKSIEYFARCIQIEAEHPPASDDAITPYAKQNIASALVKHHRYEEALNVLQSIPPGKWWAKIRRDDDLLSAPNIEFRLLFEQISDAKITEN